MMHKAWSSIEEVPYCFSRSPVKFQGPTALKIIEFDPNWAFPDCNSSLNSPMATKCCTKLETAKERCPIVFQGHPSNFKVTRDKTSPNLTQIGRFRTIGRLQPSNPSDLPCYICTRGSHESGRFGMCAWTLLYIHPALYKDWSGTIKCSALRMPDNGPCMGLNELVTSLWVSDLRSLCIYLHQNKFIWRVSALICKHRYVAGV